MVSLVHLIYGDRSQAFVTLQIQAYLSLTLDEHLSSLDVELLRGVSGLGCTLQDGSTRLRRGRAGHRQGLGPRNGFNSRAPQLDGSALADRNCSESRLNELNDLCTGTFSSYQEVVFVMYNTPYVLTILS